MNILNRTGCRVTCSVLAIVAVLLGARTVYDAAYGSASWGTRDDACRENLDTIWRTYQGNKEAFDRGEPSAFEAIRQLRLACPRGGEYELFDEGGWQMFPNALVLCRSHREPRPGWNFRRDPAAFLMLKDGTFLIVDPTTGGVVDSRKSFF